MLFFPPSSQFMWTQTTVGNTSDFDIISLEGMKKLNKYIRKNDYNIHFETGCTDFHTCTHTHILKALPGYRHAQSAVMVKVDVTPLC